MLDATSYAQAKSIAKREAQEVACEIPIATTSTVGTVKIGNGINVDAAGTITPDTANIDVTQLKNFSSLTTGSPKGFFDSTATLANFSSCVKGDFFIYDGAETFSLGGYTFNSGDQLWCTTATTTTPANLTNNFAYVPESTAQATTESFGTVKLGSTAPLMDSTATVGVSAAMSREDHVHPSDTSKVSTATTVNGHALSGNVSVTASDVGLGNANNTADANKNVLSATKLTTARKIYGDSFDGTADVTPVFLQLDRGVTDQTLVGQGSDLIFNEILVSSGSIPFNTTTGVVTLTANRWYELSGEPAFNTFSDTTNGYMMVSWVDATTNNLLYYYDQTAGIYTSSNSRRAFCFYKPTTNQIVKLRITAATGTATFLRNYGSKAVIKQIG